MQYPMLGESGTMMPPMQMNQPQAMQPMPYPNLMAMPPPTNDKKKKKKKKRSSSSDDGAKAA